MKCGKWLSLSNRMMHEMTQKHFMVLEPFRGLH